MSQAKELEDVDDSPLTGTKTSADGGSGITATIFTATKRTRIKKLVTRVSNSGSASEIRLKVAGQRIAYWKNQPVSPYSFNDIAGLRGIFDDSQYPDANRAYEDLKDFVLEAGQTIAYDGNFASNFNATVQFALTTYEEQ